MFKPKATQEERQTLFQTARFVLYFAAVYALTLLIWQLSSLYRAETFVEHGIVENIQLLFLLTAGGVFWIESYFLKQESPLLLLFGALCFFAFCRELDNYFEKLIPIISWKFCFLFPAVALVNLYRHRSKARSVVLSFLRTPAFYLMFTAVIICIPVAQCLGHKPMLAQVLGGEVDARLARRIIEESLEVIGYFLLLLSAIECFVNSRRKK